MVTGISWSPSRVITEYLSFTHFSSFSMAHVQVGPRERSPSRKNVAVGQPQLGAALQVSASESAMDAPRHRVPVFLITRDPQPGKFMSFRRCWVNRCARRRRAGFERMRQEWERRSAHIYNGVFLSVDDPRSARYEAANDFFAKMSRNIWNRMLQNTVYTR